jgi:hypothetical protein
MASSSIDYTSFEDAVIATLPPPLRIVFQHYDPLRAEDGLVVVVPPDDATNLALSHPRNPGGESRGVLASDRLGLIPNDLDERLIGELVARADQRHLVVHVATEPSQSTDALQMEPEALRACVSALPPNAVADLVMPSTLLNDARMGDFRRFLITKGQVTDLFDAAEYVWVGWSSDPEIRGDATQVVHIPAPDQWPEFISDLETSFFLWRWGDLTRLPLNRPWTRDAIEPDMVSSLRRFREEIAGADTRATPERMAYVKIAYIEKVLQYLVHLRVGDDPEDLWPLVKPRTRESAAARWGSGRRGRPEHFLDLTAFTEILDRGWDLFAPAFDSDGSKTKREAMPRIAGILELRNRVMHPVRLSAQHITEPEMRRLDDLVVVLDRAVEVAEEIDMNNRPS